MSSFGIDGIAAAAARAAFVVFLLVGIHAPVGHAMPRTQKSGQAPKQARQTQREAEIRKTLAALELVAAPLPVPAGVDAPTVVNGHHRIDIKFLVQDVYRFKPCAAGRCSGLSLDCRAPVVV
jgi:hypothetical protein